MSTHKWYGRPKSPGEGIKHFLSNKPIESGLLGWLIIVIFFFWLFFS